MSLEATSDLWWKSAILCCVDTQSFLDSNGDGIGDLDGLTQRIDYLAGLGVTCLWLMPIYPSPERDYGYDVADYYGVAEKYGSLSVIAERRTRAACGPRYAISRVQLCHARRVASRRRSAEGERCGSGRPPQLSVRSSRSPSASSHRCATQRAADSRSATTRGSVGG